MARTKKTPTRARTPPITYTEIPLKTPTRHAPSGKTLVDIIDTHRPRDPSGAPIPSSTPAEEEEIFGPGMQAFCLTVPFCMLLGTFDYLVHLQYRQEVDLRGIIWRVIKASPAIFSINYAFHSRRNWLSVQLLLLTISVLAGCWLVRAVNRTGYYAVMKRAPQVGTLWIWAAVEMNLVPVLGSCLLVGGYSWYFGYSWV
ncbi:unnamed protein product [Tuber aestivum]|uniref:DUF7719 domain-containing protein n=1 Tax=Tuber aestivum TaxID=59557 RepID=A0A292PJB1_9PEZI|nr:unnamed protein product [Tuber aestivum]